jgi:hypothetical protein
VGRGGGRQGGREDRGEGDACVHKAFGVMKQGGRQAGRPRVLGSLLSSSAEQL